jgi:hypothetical protein
MPDRGSLVVPGQRHLAEAGQAGQHVRLAGEVGDAQGDILSRVISVDMVLGYAVASLSLVLCGAVAGHRPAPMFALVAAVLAVTAIGTLSSRSVRQMR